MVVASSERSSSMLSGSTNAMLQSSFHEAVDAAFQDAAVQVDDGVEKVLFKPGIEGLHIFFEGCRSKAQRSEVREDIVSVESLTKVFDEKKWPHDCCWKREDVGSLLELLGIAESKEEKLLVDVAELMDDIQKRTAMKQFPLLCTKYLTSEDEKRFAQQSFGLVEMMDAVKVLSYIDLQKQIFSKVTLTMQTLQLKRNVHVGLFATITSTCATSSVMTLLTPRYSCTGSQGLLACH